MTAAKSCRMTFGALQVFGYFGNVVYIVFFSGTGIQNLGMREFWKESWNMILERMVCICLVLGVWCGVRFWAWIWGCKVWACECFIFTCCHLLAFGFLFVGGSPPCTTARLTRREKNLVVRCPHVIFILWFVAIAPMVARAMMMLAILLGILEEKRGNSSHGANSAEGWSWHSYSRWSDRNPASNWCVSISAMAPAARRTVFIPERPSGKFVSGQKTADQAILKKRWWRQRWWNKWRAWSFENGKWTAQAKGDDDGRNCSSNASPWKAR